MKALLLLFLSFVPGLTSNASAQTGIIIGKVFDERGCVVYGADVDIRSEGKLLACLFSNWKGVFEVLSVSDETYEVTVKDAQFSDHLTRIVYIDKRQRKDSLIFRFQKRSEWGLQFAQKPCGTVERGMCSHCFTRISLGPNPPFYSPRTPGNETTILAEDLERMPY